MPETNTQPLDTANAISTDLLVDDAARGPAWVETKNTAGSGCRHFFQTRASAQRFIESIQHDRQLKDWIVKAEIVTR